MSSVVLHETLTVEPSWRVSGYVRGKTKAPKSVSPGVVSIAGLSSLVSWARGWRMREVVGKSKARNGLHMVVGQEFIVVHVQQGGVRRARAGVSAFE